MDLPEDQQIHHYWIELRDGSVRVMPLQAFKRIHIPTKKGAPQLPDETELQVEALKGVGVPLQPTTNASESTAGTDKSPSDSRQRGRPKRLGNGFYSFAIDKHPFAFENSKLA